MPSRRSHTNSHHGCKQCKARRVKCDQTLPRCLRCSKRNSECTYQHLMSSYDPFVTYNNPASHPPRKMTLAQRSGSPKSEPSSTVWPLSGPDAPPPVTSISPAETRYLDCQFASPLQPSLSWFEPRTARLIHHYFTHLSNLGPFKDAPSPEFTPSFNVAIRKHSPEKPYVQDGILAFAALHLASVTDSNVALASPWLRWALEYKASAIKGFRPVVETITPTNCEPALAASAALTACAFAAPLAGDQTHPIDLLWQVASLYQGTAAIFRLGWQKMQNHDSVSPKVRQYILASMAGMKSWPEAEASLDLTKEAAMTIDDAEFGRKNSLLFAAEQLKGTLRRVAGAPGVYSTGSTGLGMIGPEMVQLVRKRDPYALILMAHWVVGLEDVRHIWWVRGWPERTINAVMAEVGPRYADLMAWPLKTLREGSGLVTRDPQSFSRKEALVKEIP